MCSYIVMRAELKESSGKGPKGWMRIDTANIYYDHPVHARSTTRSASISSTRPRAVVSGSPWNSPPNPPAS